MIRLASPSIALHSHDVPGYKYPMDYTINLAAGASALVVVSAIRNAVQQSAGKFLHNVVINCHGGSGALYVGGGGSAPLDDTTISPFDQMRGEVGRIWLVACQVARGKAKRKGPEGIAFCAALAVTADCEVVAARRSQHVNGVFAIFHPKNHIDRFEGTVYLFSPLGTYAPWHPISDPK